MTFIVVSAPSTAQLAISCVRWVCVNVCLGCLQFLGLVHGARAENTYVIKHACGIFITRHVMYRSHAMTFVRNGAFVFDNIHTYIYMYLNICVCLPICACVRTCSTYHFYTLAFSVPLCQAGLQCHIHVFRQPLSTLRNVFASASLLGAAPPRHLSWHGTQMRYCMFLGRGGRFPVRPSTVRTCSYRNSAPFLCEISLEIDGN